jgi:hypothetical protein
MRYLPLRYCLYLNTDTHSIACATVIIAFKIREIALFLGENQGAYAPK